MVPICWKGVAICGHGCNWRAGGGVARPCNPANNSASVRLSRFCWNCGVGAGWVCSSGLCGVLTIGDAFSAPSFLGVSDCFFRLEFAGWEMFSFCLSAVSLLVMLVSGSVGGGSSEVASWLGVSMNGSKRASSSSSSIRKL